MIIAFNGPMGSGKSTAVEAIKFLSDKQKAKVRVVKFAGALYDMQEMIYRRIESVYKRPDDFVKDRKLLQWLGTDWGRDTIRQDIWVALWRADALELERQGFIVVTDDCRFDNEAEAVREVGGLVVRIDAPTIAGRAVVTNGIAGHASEKGIRDNLVHHTIVNDSTLSAYQDKLINYFSSILASNNGAK